MKSYEHLSYDPIAWADELARLDVITVERVRELKRQKREGKNEKEIFTLAANFYERDRGDESG